MRKLTLICATLTLTVTAFAQVDEHPLIMPGTPAKTIPAPSPWLTGEQLLRQLERPNETQAIQYIKGVFDATESGLWCYTARNHIRLRKQEPAVMRAETLAYLRKQPSKKLRDRAAVLIVQMWQERWPCPPDSCCI